MAKIAYSGHVAEVFLPPITGITGDPLAGAETGNRQPPAYPVAAAPVRLPPTEIGSEVLYRNALQQATAQAFKSWIPSAANTLPDKKEG